MEIVEIDKDFQQIQDLDILLQKILSRARSFVRADAGTIYIRKDNKLHFRYSQNDSLSSKLPPGEKLLYSFFTIPIDHRSIAGYVAKTKKVLNITDVYKLENTPYSFAKTYDELSGYKTKSMLTIPLLNNEQECIGVIQMINALGSKGRVTYFKGDDELLVEHFANAASMAIQRAQLTRQMLLRMIAMAQLRDPKETGAHVNRVASISLELYERWAAKKNMDNKELENTRDHLRIAAMLHDVGKVAISDVILKKPGRFTDHEYKIMKAHTYLGAKLFQSRQSPFDIAAQQVALTHHENWDGSGYPGINLKELSRITEGELHYQGPVQNLKGDSIPIYGRIVALADVYDALSCKRVYKEPWPEEKVLKEMDKLAGSKFDPELVSILLNSVDHFRPIFQKYPDESQEEEI